MYSERHGEARKEAEGRRRALSGLKKSIYTVDPARLASDYAPGRMPFSHSLKRNHSILNGSCETNPDEALFYFFSEKKRLLRPIGTAGIST